MNAADTTWVLASTALVLLMTPGLALFYGGMVSTRNVLSTLMHSFFAMGIITVVWIVVGYSLAFGPGNSFIGDFSMVGLKGVTAEPNGVLALVDGKLEPAITNIPHVTFMGFQMMFAIITPALISGAFAERLKFRAYAVFIVLWSILIYAPLAHWVWHPHGWVAQDGGLDFAGGLVVHASSGVSALIFALVIGKRKRPAPPHNLPMVLTGAGMLWFGWFGFNAGSALAADGLAATALVNTHVAAAGAMLSWLLAETLKHGKATALGAASGLVAGLVVITPCAGFVSPMSSLWIGLIGGVVCFGGVLLKGKLGYDDSLDAFGVHGIGGIVGGLLLGVFADTAWNEGGANGLLLGDSALFVANLKATVIGVAFAALGTFIILKILDATIGLRVSEEVEEEGLDQHLHGERAYSESSGGSHVEA
ncbi:MAG: ammonia channel protein [Sorangiineae bacterium NIC37A_2]|jgi:Amt family ammonium transporter|nr:MAG: ammonia channel protein [Sorangiineae bacterium NIC37A_2]